MGSILLVGMLHVQVRLVQVHLPQRAQGHTGNAWGLFLMFCKGGNGRTNLLKRISRLEHYLLGKPAIDGRTCQGGVSCQ